jgi:hypothetical protein
MKNTLIDLNNHLFEQIERLNDEELDDNSLEKEIKRTKAMASLATNIIDNARLALDSQKFVEELYGYETKRPKLPEMLEGK